MTEEALRKAIGRLRKDMLATARRYFPLDNRAEDMVQDALFRLWEIRDTLKEPVNGIANILVRNISIDFLRRNRPAVDIENIEETVADTGNNAMHERYLRIMAIIDRLPNVQQTLVRLRLIDGMEYGEIAKLTGMKEAAIRQNISRARLAIRQKYRDCDED